MHEALTTTRPEAHDGTLAETKGLDPEKATIDQCNNAFKKIFGLTGHIRIFTRSTEYAYTAEALVGNDEGPVTPAMLQQLADALQTVDGANPALDWDKTTFHHTPPGESTVTPKTYDRLTLKINAPYNRPDRDKVKNKCKLIAEALNKLAETKGVDISSVSRDRWS